MFCGKCGAKNDDDALFCTSCGSKLESVETAKPATGMKKDPAARHRMVGIAAVALVAVLVISIVSVLFVKLKGRSYNDVIDAYVRYSTNVDIESLLDLYPKKILSELAANEGYDSVKDCIKAEKEKMQSYTDKISDVNWKIKHRVISVEDVSGEDLVDLKIRYKDWKIKVSQAKTAYIDIDMIVEGELWNTDSMELSMIKVGNSWYVDYESMGSPF